METHSMTADLAWRLAYERGDYETALLHMTAALELFESRGHATSHSRALLQNNLADVDLRLGRNGEARSRLTEHVEFVLSTGHIPIIVLYAATFAEAVSVAHPLVCARVFGASATMRVVEALPDSDWGQAEDERVMGSARALVSPGEWDGALEQGRREDLFDLLREMAALPESGGRREPEDEN